MGNRVQVISDCNLMLEMLTDHMKMDAQIEKANEEIALVNGLVSVCVRECGKILGSEGVQQEVR